MLHYNCNFYWNYDLVHHETSRPVGPLGLILLSTLPMKCVPPNGGVRSFFYLRDVYFDFALVGFWVI